MALLEEGLREVTKDELENLSWEYQRNFNLTPANFDRDMDELRKDFQKLEVNLAISRSVNIKLRDRIISLELQYWSNSQQSRR